MSRGPPSHRARAEAIPVARRRGTIQMAACGQENLYDFAIVSSLPVAFVRVSYCARIHTPIAVIKNDFEDLLIRLSRISRHDAISRELWLRSRHGTWRFFRLAENVLVELGWDGLPLPGEIPAGPLPARRG